jgi:hypothetical protein
VLLVVVVDVRERVRAQPLGSGSVSSLLAEADQSLTVLSSEAETKWWPPLANAMPRTKPVCAATLQVVARSVRFHLRISPSVLPEHTVTSSASLFAM